MYFIEIILLSICVLQAQTGGTKNVTMGNVISLLKCMTNMLNSKCKILDEMITPLELVFVLADRYSFID